jgi:hypothetical protein
MLLSSLGLMGIISCNSSTKESGQEDAFQKEFLREMKQLVFSADVYSEINPLESRVAELEQGVLSPWVSSWTRKEKGPSTGLNWSTSATVVRELDGVEESDWLPASVQLSEAGTDSDYSKDYLQSFSTINSFSLVVYDAAHRESNTEIWVRYDLRGTLLGGDRQHDRGQIRLLIDSNNSIIEATALDMERLVLSRAPSFTDSTEEWGLNAIPMSDRKEAIRRGGYALAVADYDNDKHPDVLVGNYGPIKLMRNTGTGFEDVTLQAGLDEDGLVKSAAFADLDNDGDRDLILLRFVVDAQDTLGNFVLYENTNDGQFVKHEHVLPRSRQYDRAMPLTLADLNGDGLLDVYIGFPGIRDFTSGIAARTRPSWLASQGVWFNQGGLSFSEISESNIILDNEVYAHAALASDLNNDGVPELIIVDDSGRTNPIYQMSEGGVFVNAAEEMGLASSGLSMGITTGDFNGDGRLDLITTNVTLMAGERIINEALRVGLPHPAYTQNFLRLKEDYKALRLYTNQGDGQFVEALQSGLTWSGDAAGAGEWIDYNHDGLLDYYLPNGLWSSGEKSIDSLFFRAELSADHDPLQRGVDPEKDALYDSRSPDEQSGNVMQNDVHGGPIFEEPLDANPMLRFLREADDEDGKLKYSLGGHQHNRLYRNNGDGTFTEVGFLEGADRIEDGYIVSPVDVNNDGRQDLILRNTDPAPQTEYLPVVFLRNDREDAKTLSLHLSHGSNETSVGAQVHAWIGEKHILRELRSVNGAVQADPTVIIGMGDSNSIDRLEVLWPSGVTVSVTDVSAGELSLSPPEPTDPK